MRGYIFGSFSTHSSASDQLLYLLKEKGADTSGFALKITPLPDNGGFIDFKLNKPATTLTILMEMANWHFVNLLLCLAAFNLMAVIDDILYLITSEGTGY